MNTVSAIRKTTEDILEAVASALPESTLATIDRDNAKAALAAGQPAAWIGVPKGYTLNAPGVLGMTFEIAIITPKPDPFEAIFEVSDLMVNVMQALGISESTMETYTFGQSTTYYGIQAEVFTTIGIDS